MLAVKIGLVALGSILLLFGAARLFWEFYSWGVLSKMDQRPAFVGEDPRIHYQGPAVQSAVGLTLIIAGVLL